MTDQTIDVSAAMDAAAAALAQPAETTPAGVYAAHQCQTGCGRLATVVVVRLADSDLDILCDVCYMLMLAAIADAVQETAPLPDTAASA